jgi:hypothetical protein
VKRAAASTYARPREATVPGRSVAVDRQVPGRAAAARIRAMITLWQQGGKHRAEVDKLARDLR